MWQTLNTTMPDCAANSERAKMLQKDSFKADLVYKASDTEKPVPCMLLLQSRRPVVRVIASKHVGM